MTTYITVYAFGANLSEKLIPPEGYRLHTILHVGWAGNERDDKFLIVWEFVGAA
jgi:hypothetical protein